MEELLECPLCGGTILKFFLTCTDFTVSKEKFNIVSCTNCNFKFTNPRPDFIHINRYYESEDYISHSNIKTGFINKLYHIIKKIAINNKISIINNLKTRKKDILDIGCGTGTFLGTIKERGWNVSGIEPNTNARKLAIKNYSIPVFDEQKILSLSQESFSIITLWHVLEHVHSLKQRISDIYRLLEKNGFAIIAVPNNTSWDAIHYQSIWAAYDVPRHLYHFSPTTIKKLFQDQNFIHIKSLPMKFDSYYVCMLSEKYKKSFLKLIKASIFGWWSNIIAKNNAEKYSSVIYIFQKK